MTTTAYDTHFIASDIAFTDDNDNVHLDISFRKVKRIGDSVIGMAGCLHCMQDFSQMIVDFITGNIDKPNIPRTIIDRTDRDFIALVYISGICLQITRLRNTDVQIENITAIPVVIGSGSHYVKGVIDDCPNAVVAVLEAIRRDKYTDGEVKYCSILRDDIHNLEAHPMSTELHIQVTGLQNELKATNDFLGRQENIGKSFKASTETYYKGTPSPISVEAGMLLLEQGFSKIKDSLSAKNSE